MRKIFIAAVLIAAGCGGSADTQRSIPDGGTPAADGSLAPQQVAPQQLPPRPGFDPMASTVSVDRATATADGADTVTITVTVLDITGRPMAGQMVLLGATGARDQMTQPSAATDANGVATGSLTSTRAENKTISALVGSTAIAQQATIRFDAGPEAVVVFQAQPSSAAAGAPIAPAVVAAIQDSYGNPVSATDVVTLTLLDPGSGGRLSGTTSVAAVNGVARFTDLSIDRAASGYRLNATAFVLVPAVSTLFTITSGAP